jgi:hypothetical protein
MAAFATSTSPRSAPSKYRHRSRRASHSGTGLHERLGKLGNRVDPTTQGKILGDVHARIPMVTLDEQHALKLENTEADERFWTNLRDTNQANAEDHKRLLATTERTIANMESAAAKAAAARDRVERLRRGEDVPGGVGKPLTLEDILDILRKAGMTTAEIRHCEELAALHKAMHKVRGDAAWPELMDELTEARNRAERATVRRLLAQWRVSDPD